ncbi:THO complex subunit 7 [Basidiobolus ranarum]|uniref:THO complex subunit 7 n=1 Tax=Basidiobolus ranarum TaxID=34480 RepID=A0ABR2W5W4_9FUNG
MDDDTIIRNRLSVDERPLKRCLKRFLTWSNSIKAASMEEAELQFPLVVAEFAQYEQTMLRNQFIQDMSQVQVKHFAQDSDTIAQDIKATQNAIQVLSKQLKEAQVELNNKIEYDKMTKEIRQHPNREDSLRDIHKLKTDIAKLESENVTHTKSMELRQEQFRMILDAISNMQRALKEEKDVAENKSDEPKAFDSDAEPDDLIDSMETSTPGGPDKPDSQPSDVVVKHDEVKPENADQPVIVVEPVSADGSNVGDEEHKYTPLPSPIPQSPSSSSSESGAEDQNQPANGEVEEEGVISEDDGDDPMNIYEDKPASTVESPLTEIGELPETPGVLRDEDMDTM